MDSAAAIAAEVRATFGGTPGDSVASPAQHRFFVTDAPEKFLGVAGRFLGRPVVSAEHVDV